MATLEGDGSGGGGASTMDDLTDVTAPTPANDEVLAWNGSAWVNVAAAAGGGDAVTVHHLRMAGADTNVSDGDTIPFDTEEPAAGLGLAAGVFTIPAGSKASLAGAVGVSNGAGDYIDAQWYDVTNAAYIGSVGSTYAPALSFNSHPAGTAFAFVDATAGAVDVRLRALDSGDDTLVNGLGRTGAIVTVVTPAGVPASGILEAEVTTASIAASGFEDTLIALAAANVLIVGASIERVGGSGQQALVVIYKDAILTDMQQGLFGEAFSPIFIDPGPELGPRAAGISSGQFAIPFFGDGASSLYLRVNNEDFTNAATYRIKVKYMSLGAFAT